MESSASHEHFYNDVINTDTIVTDIPISDDPNVPDPAPLTESPGVTVIDTPLSDMLDFSDLNVEDNDFYLRSGSDVLFSGTHDAPGHAAFILSIYDGDHTWDIQWNTGEDPLISHDGDTVSYTIDDLNGI